MSNILVMGCGDLAWGRPSVSPIFGRRWNRGRISAKIHLRPGGGSSPGEVAGGDWVSLAEELDREVGWWPAGPLGPAPEITIEREMEERAPALPTWAELAESQARWATGTLEGSGVLVTPGAWRESIKGHQLLAAWVDAGWSWAALEEALQESFSADSRFAAASGLWLRLTQPEGHLVLPNGPEAARALEVTVVVLERILAAVEGDLVARWRKEEEDESGWFLRQQVTRKIANALRKGQRRVELGGAGLFRFSAAGADRYRPFSALRIVIELPKADVSWWERIERKGALHRADGTSYDGIRWESRKTIVLEGEETRQIYNFLNFRSLPQETFDPARLEAALSLGAPLALPPSSGTAVVTEESEASVPMDTHALLESDFASESGPVALPEAVSEAVPEEAPYEDVPVEQGVPPNPAAAAPLLTELPEFLPHQFSLSERHRPESLRVWIDENRIDPANVRPSIRPGIYVIEGFPVSHGAIVRVDFEPVE